ncbi:succinylglutamate desuccinylase/aspartoacylase family protein [Marinobacterium arenosum]|uniref:succinylglutamate desuccinylase/aspartoacylase family protein n=1 Tax=Marinobacterium arenosum TaxID=2862496 RepID=UPI001C93EA9C|nr:succinylglutamate desuccinylase/aspartoacylase family protein [Marinobacterium arenosum]MBY4677755.1 succinylglutamate desuccinylase/aspartoacylase family protein [Marinobacterium arenosum]
MAIKRQPDWQLLGQRISPGHWHALELEITPLFTTQPLSVSVHVLRGRRPGPTLLVSAAIHGDELNGVEVCRRLLCQTRLSRLRGTLIVVPVVNLFGFIQHSRYLPDRRDLNRCFPGSEKGSLASRLAYRFRTELLAHCSHMVDLHTGAINRSNLPQIRANLDNPTSAQMARDFGAPVILNSELRDGSLRECAESLGIPVIVYEAGEALRLDERAIRGGLHGLMNVMRGLEMLPARRSGKRHPEPVVARTSSWLRAPQNGLIINQAELGQRIKKGDTLALIGSPFTPHQEPIKAAFDGLVIGQNNIPLVNEGDALFHIARFDAVSKAERTVEAFGTEIDQKEHLAPVELPEPLITDDSPSPA